MERKIIETKIRNRSRGSREVYDEKGEGKRTNVETL